MGPLDVAAEECARMLLEAGTPVDEAVNELMRIFDEDLANYPPEMQSEPLDRAMAEHAVLSAARALDE